MTEELPDEIIELIMHFMGAYTHNKEERPYIDDIKLIKDITEYGVKRSILHIKEMRAQQKSYNGRENPSGLLVVGYFGVIHFI
mgnify:CR=1 FL=1|jgi:hypothetical protein